MPRRYSLLKPTPSPGYFCPTGSANPVPCASGTYNPAQQQATCLACPIGYFCEQGSKQYISNICPAGLHFGFLTIH